MAQEAMQLPEIDAPKQTPGLGAGFRLNTDPYIGQKSSIDLVPLYLYEGKYLYAHGTNFGGHLLNKEHFELNLEARFRFAQLLPDEDNTYMTGIEDRNNTWEGGATATVKGRFGNLKLGWYTDLDSNHNGQETNLTYRYRFDVGNWMISPYVSGMLLDSDISNYYFGVSPTEGAANPNFGAYELHSTFNYEGGINTWYQLTDHVFMFGNFGLRVLDDNISNSPLVGEDKIAMAYIGAGYLFGDDSPRRYEGKGISNWSWRVNYGFQQESNIFPGPMAGDIKKSTVADTNIAGFTLGKLFQGGDRAEFWGKFAVFRHFESPTDQVSNGVDHPNTEDFWSFAAYIMAMGKGYSPWSNKLLFRYGIGLGVSYAEDIPLAEKIKQARKNENTNQLLNYLEFTVDFPVDRLIKSQVTKNCFFGITLVHRSGIFANSDILGSVAGGSDWATLSYECIR